MKKKLKSSLGDVIVPNKHPVSQMSNNFRMTPYLQDQVCYIGQKEVFEEGSETIQRLTGVEVSNKQIQRVSEHYGQCLEEEIEKSIKDDSLKIPIDYTEIIYGMVDGSMLFTKEEKWKEIKLGRIFKAIENIAITENRNWIKESKYCAYLGGHEAFLERFELLLNGAINLVLIADGAKWFWDWVSIYYPQAIQILDYYHCKEHLCEFARLAFKDERQKEKWIKVQDELFFKDKIKKVITNIKTVMGLSGDAFKCQQKIITYFENNSTRMFYGTYRNKGLLIGSGPIESAHRNVIQERLKLSGQRWSKKGIQQIANLRIAFKNNEWGRVVHMIQSVVMAA
jgi:hypothetical protein